MREVDPKTRAQQEDRYRYVNDTISCLELDETNGILFTGSVSGKVRAHLWPMPPTYSFQHYSELQVAFSRVENICITPNSPCLYVGTQDGNISRVRYLIDHIRE